MSEPQKTPSKSSFLGMVVVCGALGIGLLGGAFLQNKSHQLGSAAEVNSPNKSPEGSPKPMAVTNQAADLLPDSTFHPVATGYATLLGGYKVKLPAGWTAVPTGDTNLFLASPTGAENINTGIIIQKLPVESLQDGWKVILASESGHRVLRRGQYASFSTNQTSIQTSDADLFAPPIVVVPAGQNQPETRFTSSPQRRLYTLVQLQNPTEFFAVVGFVINPNPDDKTLSRSQLSVLAKQQIVELAQTLGKL